ncbi:MAG: hypothetical protein KDI46_08625 [Alphaproteobacteria bacterium]|nr:hypothetical protein [Alphaproteobacteria bacterium]
MNQEDTEKKQGGCGGHCGCAHKGEGNGPENGEVLKTFDMYHFFSRKDVILAIIFLIVFLIFSLAVLFYPDVI